MGLGFRGQGIAGNRLLQFGHRPEGSGPQRTHRLLPLALRQEELAVALREGPGHVEHGAVRSHGARVDPENGEPPGVGVGHGLEDLGRQGPVRVRLQGHFLAVGGLALHLPPVLGRGEIEVDGIQQQGGTQVVVGGPAEHRHDAAFERPDPEALVNFFGAELPFFQKLFDEGVVAFRGEIEEVAAQEVHFVLQVLGDRGRFQLTALAHISLEGYQIHHPFKGGLPPDGELQRHRRGFQDLLDFLERLGEVGPLPVHLVDEDQPGKLVLIGRVPHFLGAHLDAVHRVHHHDGRVAHVERRPGVRQKVVVAGGVGQINRILFPLVMVKGAGNGNLALDLFGLVIQDGTAVIYFSQPGGGPRPEEEGLGQGGLAATAVADEDQITDLCCLAGHQKISLPSRLLPRPKVTSRRRNLFKLPGFPTNLNRFSGDSRRHQSRLLVRDSLKMPWAIPAG